MLANSTLASHLQHTAPAVRPGLMVQENKVEDKNAVRRLLALIEAARLVSRQELDEAREIAQSLGQPLEQVLISSGFMTSKLLKNCREALFYIEQEKCTQELAICGLEMAWRKELSFESGLRYFGWGW